MLTQLLTITTTHKFPSLGVEGGVLQAEAGAEEGRLEEEVDQVLDGLVVLVRLGPAPQVVDDRVVRVDLQKL